MNIQKGLGIGAASLAFASVALVSVGTSPAEASPCGYYEVNGQGWYNHCGRYNAMIEVNQGWRPTYYSCFAPGTNVALLEHATYARATGDRCWARSR